MGRVFKVALYAVIILIIYLWITAIMNSRKKLESNNAVQSEIQENPPLPSDTAENIINDTIGDETGYISNEDIVSGKIPYKDVDKTIEELNKGKAVSQPESNNYGANSKQNPELQKSTEKTSKPVTTANKQETNKPAIKPQPVQSKTVQLNESGDYLVVAGSYILEDNANKMAKKLRGMGFESAGVVVFKASEYYSVVASRHPSHDKAQIAADVLKRKGVDCFVKKKS